MDYKEYERLFDECYEQGGFDDIYMVKKGDGYVYELYVDYKDDFHYLISEALSKVDDFTDADSIRDIVNQALYEAYEDYESDMLDDVQEAFENWLEENEIEYDSDDVRDCCMDCFYCSYDSVYKHAYNTEIPVDVILKGDDLYIYNDVTDGGFSNGGKADDFEGTSFEKFLNMSGHSLEEFKELEETGYDSAKPETFMESVVVDFRNCCFNTYNQITFLGGITLNDLLDKIGSQQPLIIKQDAICGLWDFYSGCGGLMIDLEGDFEIPFGEYEIKPDSKGGIDNTCGFVGEVWRGHIE